MKNWTRPAITIMAVAAMSYVAAAQSGADKMAQPMGKDKTYTGCVEAGTSAGTFTLTHITADSSMGKDAMGKDAMKKDAMGKDNMAPATLAIASKTVDLSEHVGHKVSVTGAEAGTGMSMAKPDPMGKSAPAFSVTSLTMIAATCSQ
jgi:hypothetical protein